MEARTVTLRGAELVVREWGDVHARPLVYWHGLNPFGALALNEAGPAWAARGFRVIAPAAPGCGESPSLASPEEYLPSRLAALVAELANELGLGRFSFVGWSWGATIGVHLAAGGAPLDGLVLIDAGHTDLAVDEPLEAVEQQFAAEQERFRFESWEAFFDAMRTRHRAWRPALEERFRAGAVERDGAIVVRADPRAAARAIYGVATEPPSPRLPQLREHGLPVLLVRSDEAEDAAALLMFQELLPQARVRTLHGGHDLLADAAQDTIAAVADFLGA